MTKIQQNYKNFKIKLIQTINKKPKYIIDTKSMLKIKCVLHSTWYKPNHNFGLK